MRPGIFISFVGHVGVAFMTFWAATIVGEPAPAIVGAVVPVEVVDMSEVSNVAALAPAADEDDAPAESAPEEIAPAAAEAAPEPDRRTDDRDFLASLSRDLMKDLDRDDQKSRATGAPSDRVRAGAGAGTAETARLEDRLRALARAHIARNNCWRSVSDLPDPDRLAITVSFNLDRNGNLLGAPRIIAPINYNATAPLRTAAQRALRAVEMCDPYPFASDPIAAEHYDLWRAMDYTFRLRE